MLAYEKALALMASDQYSRAADVLRMLAVANPRRRELWESLADCHDALDQKAVADVVRSVGHLALQTTDAH
jgi:predicted Zn-dependent protease